MEKFVIDPRQRSGLVTSDLEVSVVICAYTEERWHDLVASVESVKSQAVPPTEIIVVIDHNRSLFARAASELQGVSVIENTSEKGLSGARNCGLKAAHAEIVAFLDDDAEAEPMWLRHLLNCYLDPDVLGVSGRIVPRWFALRPSWFPEEFGWVVGCTYRGLPTRTGTVRNMIGANMSARRQVLVEHGGFRSGFGCNHTTQAKRMSLLQSHAGDEETELCIRISQRRPNGRWLFTPRATVHHHVSAKRSRYRYFLWRCYDEGLGKANLSGIVGSHKGLAAERSYIFRTLPLGVARGLAQATRGDLAGLARAGSVVAGLAFTSAGYLVGTVSARGGLSRPTSQAESHVIIQPSEDHLGDSTGSSSLPRTS
jgi:glycosyltransferase involved in cell wall biosynthesis